MRARLAAFFFYAIVAATANASTKPSFDCSKARTTVEHLICSDENLSQVDSRLTSLYKLVLSTAESKESERKKQALWRTTIRDICTDKLCLQDAYQQRIVVLEKMVKEKTNSLQSDINKPIYPLCASISPGDYILIPDLDNAQKIQEIVKRTGTGCQFPYDIVAVSIVDHYEVHITNHPTPNCGKGWSMIILTDMKDKSKPFIPACGKFDGSSFNFGVLKNDREYIQLGVLPLHDIFVLRNKAEKS